jgi:hypothetical protein
MTTTVHIPDDILEQIDRRARDLKISRNRYIIESLRRTLSIHHEWPPEFLERIRGWSSSEAEVGEAVDDMVAAIQSNRRSRRRQPL